jgi:hypothetical protein
MKPESRNTLRWILIPAVFILGGACIFSEAAAGPTPTPQIIVVTATPENRPADTEEPAPPPGEPTATQELAPTPTVSLEPVTMTAGQSLSCVKGPHWILFEWVASIAEGETVTLLAKASEDWEEYYYVRKADGKECWAFGGSSTKTGDPSLLPVREAPPLPEINFSVINETGLDIGDIFIREKDAASWGADKISANLHPGESFSLTLTAGFYDLKINDFTGGTLMEKYNRPIGADAGYRQLAVNEQMEFYIENHQGVDICKIRVRRVGGSDWAIVHEDGDHVANGERATFLLLPARYDLEVYRCSGPLVDSGPNLYFGPSTPGYTSP